LCEEAIKVAEVRQRLPGTPVTLRPISSTAAAVSGSRRPVDEDVGAFAHEPFRRGKANAAIATRNERDFRSSLPNVFLLGLSGEGLTVLGDELLERRRLPSADLLDHVVGAREDAVLEIDYRPRANVDEEGNPCAPSGFCSNSPYMALAVCSAGGFWPPEAMF